MVNAERIREGHCLCGAVRFRALGESDSTTWCHCTMCRRASGTPGVAWATYAVSQVIWSGEPLVRYASSNIAERGFCARCGGALLFQFREKPESIDLAVGAFDDPESLPPQDHIFTDTRVAWMDAGPNLPIRQPEPKTPD